MPEFCVRSACIFRRTISLYNGEEKTLIWGKRGGDHHLSSMWYILGPMLDTLLNFDYTVEYKMNKE